MKIINEAFFLDGKQLLRSHHAQWKKHQLDSERRKALYNSFKFKQVTLETGVTEWYGCSRDQPRCFPPVINSVPSYLYEGKWTPPCCLSNLRRTARHVFNCLDDAGVRYVSIFAVGRKSIMLYKKQANQKWERLDNQSSNFNYNFKRHVL